MAFLHPKSKKITSIFILTLLIGLLCPAKLSLAANLADSQLTSEIDYNSGNWEEVPCTYSYINYEGQGWQQIDWYNYAGSMKTLKYSKAKDASIEFTTPAASDIVVEMSTKGTWIRSTSVHVYIDNNLAYDWNLKDSATNRYDYGQKLLILSDGEVKPHTVKIVNNVEDEYIFFWGYSYRKVEQPPDNHVVLADLTVDNGFDLYISTSDYDTGTLVKSGDDWQKNYHVAIPLTPNVVNYIHIKANDWGEIAGLIGDFTLKDEAFTFSTGNKYLVTNTSDWQVSRHGFGKDYESPTTSSGPWGGAPSQVDDNAKWIWTNNGRDVNTSRYFSTSIKPVNADGPIRVFIDNVMQYYPQPPVIMNNRVMVPMSSIFQALGATVSWDAESQTVTALKGYSRISMQVGSSIVYKDASSMMLDQPAVILNGRTMVPVGFVSAVLGYKVNWVAATKSVMIATN